MSDAERHQSRGEQHPQSEDRDVTALLLNASGGNRAALDRVFPVVYEALHNIAAKRLRAERRDHTLSATALVHECYLKLIDQSRVQWQNRAHFFAVAALAMRRVLVNHAEQRGAQKRGGGAMQVTLEHNVADMQDASLADMMALDAALNRLREFNPRGAEVVTYRFFGGLTHEEIAHVLGVSVVTVRRAWSAARSWLRRELRDVREDV